jgi:hypothetical protein
VLALRGLTSAIAGHDEDLRSALKGMAQARGIIEISLAHSDTTLAERTRLFWVANADTNLSGRNFLNESFNNGLAKLSSGPSNDDHNVLLFYFYLGRLHELAESLALVLSMDICPVEVER